MARKSNKTIAKEKVKEYFASNGFQISDVNPKNFRAIKMNDTKENIEIHINNIRIIIDYYTAEDQLNSNKAIKFTYALLAETKEDYCGFSIYM